MKNYEIGDIIDSGGMGVVYKGRHVGLERDVAIKFILPHVASDEQSVERFLREARLAGRINHPNVTHIYDTGVDDQGRPYIVMELLTGEPLKQRLTRGPMTEGDAIEITKQVLMALEKAHSMGVIHRDIKPGNIFLTTDRMAKILDFGVAKGLDSGTGNVTLAGKTVGSPAYMSPEQAEGETVDARTDLYSVGIVLYEMLSGNVPFKGENSLAIMQKHLSTPPPPLPSDVHPSIRSVVEKALAKKTDKRFASARDMLTALEKAPIRNVIVAKAASGDSLAVAGQPTPTPGRKSTKSHETATAQPNSGKKGAPIALMAIAAVLLVGGGIIAVPMFLKGKQPATTTGGGSGGSTTGESGATTGTSGETGSTSTTSGETGTTSGETGTTATTSGSTGTTATTSGSTTGTEEVTTTETKTEPIPFETQSNDDPTMNVGETKVDVEGVDGEKEVTYSVTKSGETEVKREKVSERTIREPVAKVVRVGTKPAEVATTTKTVTERESIRFRVERIPWPGLPKGQSQTIREGRNGSRVVTYQITYKDGKQVSKTQVSSKVVEAPVSKMIRVGTKSSSSTSGGTTGGGNQAKPWFCPQCGERRSASQNVCPNDGTRRP